MQSLMSRIYNQIQSTGTIYYESYFYKESGMEGGRARKGKSYIDDSVSLCINGTKKDICKNKANGVYMYTAIKPKRCLASCISCLECTFSDCMYDSDANRMLNE
jgi:hypothetical protein